MINPRSSGILLHPTSLPSRFGIGDLGDEAYRFADFLADNGQALWQVLPLGPTGYGNSPYQCFSAFAGNTMLISPERLVTEGLLTAADLERVPDLPTDRVDFGRVIDFKQDLLARAFAAFRKGDNSALNDRVETFFRAAGSWLDDYALYRAIKNANNGAAWNSWEPQLAKREPDALAAARQSHRDQIEAQKFYQFLFYDQWFSLKNYCHDRKIQIVGDVPIFMAFDSADVWAQPEYFKLDENGRPIVVAGVPPDYFSATGQLWGNPLYNWDCMREDGFQWWIKRIKGALEIFDMIRLDHFRGFSACWEVPAQDKSAEHGQWVNVPGREMFNALKQTIGDLPIIAEDLGIITPDVEALRDDFGFPGMRILQFAFSSDAKNIDLPHNYIPNCVVYTGTHDNDTTVGWFNSHAGTGSTRSEAQISKERDFCLNYLNSDGKEIHWDFIRTVQASVPQRAIIPLQDLFGLGSNARMNLPASTESNWSWRFKAEDLTAELGARLKGLTTLYGRSGN